MMGCRENTGRGSPACWRLLQNSVGMYQIYKLLNIPLMCVFEVLWLKRFAKQTVLRRI